MGLPQLHLADAQASTVCLEVCHRLPHSHARPQVCPSELVLLNVHTLKYFDSSSERMALNTTRKEDLLPV